MNETKKTVTYVIVAGVLLLLAFIFSPKRIVPEAFVDQGELFFPDFTDPNSATSLEVISFDQASGSPKAFKVSFDGERWVIPSHHNYPADAKDRLAKTAAGVIDIKKDDFRTDNVSEHELCGVIDPLDETAGMEGRGQRITIRDNSGNTLADLIVGKPIPSRQGFRFVRLPDQKRVYACKMDLDISTSFSDWIETDLLQAAASEINRILINDYTINERTGSVNRRGTIDLTLKGDKWTAKGMKSNEIVDSASIKELLSTLDNVSIVGVRPKPAGLSKSLQADSDKMGITSSDRLSLQSKGFFFSRDGQLMSNEGELLVYTTKGVRYTLRFGEVVYGSGLAVTSGSDENTKSEEGTAQNRYLFITTTFDESLFPEPKKPSNDDYVGKPDSLMTDLDRKNKELRHAHDKWALSIKDGKKISDELNNRFADWYYVISSASFDKLKKKRNELIVKK